MCRKGRVIQGEKSASKCHRVVDRAWYARSRCARRGSRENEKNDFFSSRLHAACMYWNRSKASVSWRRTKVLVLSNASCARGPQHVRQF
ncbi:hypothetical protein Naga_101006g2 [Nannochloropsis gaditana]|uniref:Uncharacterized protein n=1 Tax=Nannochloropsis gaditana TaxID=72520 RepID=W7T860_9STRA|nr:hypothetical protein Naga_101006g2 [Nannochloropsis gaditana]